MIKVAVCDDSFADGTKTCEMVRECLRARKLEFTIEKYGSGDKLGSEYDNGKKFDIYLLDIVMPGISGIELGARIKNLDKDVLIIYTTTSEEFALEAYSIKAERYIMKPIRKEDMEEAMKYCLRLHDSLEKKVFTMKTKEGYINIDYKDIRYAESKSRAVHMFTDDGKCYESLFLRGRFEDEVKPLLEDKRFVQVHKSYLVNMDYIDVFNQTEVTLRGGTVISISKNRQNEIKSRYLAYIAE